MTLSHGCPGCPILYARFVEHQFRDLWLLGDDYDEFETLIAESLSPAEDDVTRLNEAVLEQLSSHQIERDKVEQVSVDSEQK